MKQIFTVLVTGDDTQNSRPTLGHSHLPSLSKNKQLRRQMTLSSTGTSRIKREGKPPLSCIDSHSQFPKPSVTFSLASTTFFCHKSECSHKLTQLLTFFIGSNLKGASVVYFLEGILNSLAGHCFGMGAWTGGCIGSEGIRGDSADIYVIRFYFVLSVHHLVISTLFIPPILPALCAQNTAQSWQPEGNLFLSLLFTYSNR